MKTSYKTTLDDGTIIIVEDTDPGLQLRLSKGKVHRSLGMSLEEAKMLLFVMKKWERDGRKKS